MGTQYQFDVLRGAYPFSPVFRPDESPNKARLGRVSDEPCPQGFYRDEKTVFAFVSVSLVATASAQVSVFSDEFDTEHFGIPTTSIFGASQGDPFGLSPWTVGDGTMTGGTVDLAGGMSPSAPAGSPLGRYIDLGGSTNKPGRMESLPFAVDPGQSYQITFLYDSVLSDLRSATVTVAGQTFTFGTDSKSFQTFSQAFVVPAGMTSTTLVFQDLGSTSQGIGIDGIDVSTVQAVPKPASLAALGFGALALVRRRR